MYKREELIYLAELAEQVERFDDMLYFLKSVIELKQELSTEERNLFSIACKNSLYQKINACKYIYRILNYAQLQENQKNYIVFAQSFYNKHQRDLIKFSNETLELLQKYLIQSASTPEAQVFYYKMQGDIYRQCSDFSDADQKQNFLNASTTAYEKGFSIVNTKLESTNPIKLGLALSYSVYCYEILNNPVQACKLAQSAFENAIEKYEELEESKKKDVSLLLQLLRQNLQEWTEQLKDPDLIYNKK